MKRFSILTLVLAIMLILSACGANVPASPTLSVMDMQSTSAAVAFTMIAQTQAAIPTATPIPPTATATITNTPLPTITPLPPPFAELTLTPATAGNSGGGDPCINAVLPHVLEGKTVKIRVDNSTKATINISVYLNRTIPPNVCGYRAYTLEPAQSLVINDMVEGCFTLWAWNPDPKGYFMVTNGAASCLDSSSQATFDISTRDIKLR